MYRTAIKNYLQKHDFEAMHLKAVFFDMDGVLFDSMPYHAHSWASIAHAFNLDLTVEEAYLHEGRTGGGTIDILMQRKYHRSATETEKEAIYAAKSELFNSLPEAAIMPGASQLLSQVKQEGLQIVVVTGSGQHSLLNKLDTAFPNVFQPHLMVTSFDVQHGKPHPEPYLMALAKAGVNANETLVIENAPLGVAAGVAAGLLTIAVNTGPIPDTALMEQGANLLFPSMTTLSHAWAELYTALRYTTYSDM